MGRRDKRAQARQAAHTHSTRKPVKADRRVLIVLAIVTVALVLATYIARYSGAF